jgi:hypothetical protein
MELTPGTRISALVDASGPCGFGAGANCGLVFFIDAFKVGASVVRKTVRCEMPIPEDAMRQWLKRISPYSIVEATIAALEPSGTLALADLRTCEAEDPELAVVKQELLTPVVFQSRLFGDLTLDRSWNRFTGKASCCDAALDLTVECDDDGSPSNGLVVAETLCLAEQDWHRRAKEFAADRLLPLWERSWREEDEAALTRNQFMARMNLTHIAIEKNGNFSLVHDDRDLFGGHSIDVSGNLRDGFSDAELIG